MAILPLPRPEQIVLNRLLEVPGIWFRKEPLCEFPEFELDVRRKFPIWKLSTNAFSGSTVVVGGSFTADLEIEARKSAIDTMGSATLLRTRLCPMRKKGMFCLVPAGSDGPATGGCGNNTLSAVSITSEISIASF